MAGTWTRIVQPWVAQDHKQTVFMQSKDIVWASYFETSRYTMGIEHTKYMTSLLGNRTQKTGPTDVTNQCMQEKS